MDYKILALCLYILNCALGILFFLSLFLNYDVIFSNTLKVYRIKYPNEIMNFYRYSVAGFRDGVVLMWLCVFTITSIAKMHAYLHILLLFLVFISYLYKYYFYSGQYE